MNKGRHVTMKYFSMLIKIIKEHTLFFQEKRFRYYHPLSFFYQECYQFSDFPSPAGHSLTLSCSKGEFYMSCISTLEPASPETCLPQTTPPTNPPTNHSINQKRFFNFQAFFNCVRPVSKYTTNQS